MGHRNEVINAVRISILNQPIVETNVSKSFDFNTNLCKKSITFIQTFQSSSAHSFESNFDRNRYEMESFISSIAGFDPQSMKK